MIRDDYQAIMDGIKMQDLTDVRISTAGRGALRLDGSLDYLQLAVSGACALLADDAIEWVMKDDQAHAEIQPILLQAYRNLHWIEVTPAPEGDTWTYVFPNIFQPKDPAS